MGVKKQSLIQNEKGQSLIEYIIIVALVGVGSMAAVRLLQTNLSRQLVNISRSLTGESQSIETLKGDKHTYSKKDMGEFMKGAASNENQK